MPTLDRRITLERATEQDQGYGEFDIVWAPLASVWARQRTQQAEDEVQVGGLETTGAITWTIRYRADLLGFDLATLRVRDALGHLWNIETVQESDARRRFLMITAIRSV